jgi:hypothetical protein
MAEFDELDGRLRDALGRAAEAGDSTGVADAIRARVAAGDPGTSVGSSTAPGWGGGVFSWLPWLALLVVGAVLGGAVGVSGLVGRPAGATVVDVPAALAESAPAYACVDGDRIGRLAAGTRVLATQRSEDLLWVGVRDPGSVGSTVWVGLGDVAFDGGMPAVEALPIGGACPVTVVSTPTPTPTPEPEPEPAPGDSTAPVISQASATSPFYSANGQSTTITGVANDNRGVTRVSLQIVRPDGASSTVEMQSTGGSWTYVYSSQPHYQTGLYRFVLTAFDAAGNTSSVEVSVQGT